MSMSVSAKRVPFFVAAVLFSAATMMLTVFVPRADAAGQITSRSLTLEDGASGDGGSLPSGVVKHLFTFTLPASAAVQSLVFEYCSTADVDIGGTCTTPSGLSTTGAGLGAETGDASTFTTLTNTTQGAPYVDAGTGVTPGGSTASTVELDTVTNPDGTDCSPSLNCTFYVNIQAWSGTGGTGTLLSSGTVAASVNAQIQLTGTMPESLIFCTGASITLNASNVPDCSSVTTGSVSFNQLFSPTATATATSMMAASTNASSGYAITVSGATLTDGASDTITAMPTSTTSNIGTAQFGMNLVANTTPTVGTNVQCTTTAGAVCNGEALTGYSTADNFQFKPTTTPGSPVLNNVADSTSLPSDYETYTASYIVNVPGSQPAGTYVTTLTYICTPTY